MKLAANYKLTHSLHCEVLFEKLMDAYFVNELSQFLATLYIVDLRIACHGAQVGIAIRLGGPGLQSRWGQDNFLFSKPSRLALGHFTCLPEVKLPGR
jgi:hypothetical protein